MKPAEAVVHAVAVPVGLALVPVVAAWEVGKQIATPLPGGDVRVSRASVAYRRGLHLSISRGPERQIRLRLVVTRRYRKNAGWEPEKWDMSYWHSLIHPQDGEQKKGQFPASEPDCLQLGWVNPYRTPPVDAAVRQWESDHRFRHSKQSLQAGDFDVSFLAAKSTAANW